ncbi:aspartyl/asparaginyl beta-hydroxylase domain-containing protein [Pseudomonadota bacterium]
MTAIQTAPDFKQLDIHFSPTELLADLDKIETPEWIEHVNQRAYNGNWDVFPLRCDAQHVDAHPILQSFALEGVTRWKNLPIVDQCPSFKTVLDKLQSHHFHIYSARLMRLHAGSEITEHVDHGVGHACGEVRLHVPITTNPKVEFKVNRKQVPMQPGELWYIDADKPHSVANRGETDRVHLVIDGKVNEWLNEQLTSH